MIAFDTDVITEILMGNSIFVDRAAQIPSAQQSVPIIVIEEIMRGRLNVIRRAEAGKSKISIERAYWLFYETFHDFREFPVLLYTSEAETIYRLWRQQSVQVSTHDLRIAAICATHDAILISRNRKDFEQVPGLRVEFWD
jgi:tRNA(fMet)-specific endonuclease VapC